jgi:hypothetical protein
MTNSQMESNSASGINSDVKSEGPIVAALLAMGAGVMVYGIFVVLTEISTNFKTFLTLNDGVGPLSGKTIFGVLVWLAIWAVLHPAFRRSTVDLWRAFQISLVMVGIGVLFTFPIFFKLFA